MLNLLNNMLACVKIMPAINTSFLFSRKMSLFRLILHPIITLGALQKEHFGFEFLLIIF